MKKIAIFWFRRDLRWEDNVGLHRALQSGFEVLPIFIFDSLILDPLADRSDARVSFIHQTLTALAGEFPLLTFYGEPKTVWDNILRLYPVAEVYTNHDYENYAEIRDDQIRKLLNAQGIPFYTSKDQVIFEKNEILSGGGTPYTVFTPYCKKWKAELKPHHTVSVDSVSLLSSQVCRHYGSHVIPLKQMGFEASDLQVPPPNVSETLLSRYDQTRDIPSIQGTSRLSVHLRFGTVSIRKMVSLAMSTNEKWLNELIWREFYMNITWHKKWIGEGKAFRLEYDQIPWRQSEEDFKKWCAGKTGYPLVDAGMRELNATGFMHNRVRMVVASFLVKHLLIDWRKGEEYFAEKLLDFEFSSNNGGWQWAAGSGCDAAPYFRVFNPESQAKKFDPDFKYIKKWIPEFGTSYYPKPMVDHAMARQRAIQTYQDALK